MNKKRLLCLIITKKLLLKKRFQFKIDGESPLPLVKSA